MEVEYILERVNGKQEEIVINKPIFSCGRFKDNDLICLSLAVSRQHCTFNRFPEGLFVTDLGSSNGIYVNERLIGSKKTVLLKEGDVIGIGCSSHIHTNDNFIYKLKIKQRQEDIVTKKEPMVPFELPKTNHTCEEIIDITDDDIDPLPSQITEPKSSENEVIKESSNDISNQKKSLNPSLDEKTKTNCGNNIPIKQEPIPDLIQSIQEELQWGYSQTDLVEIDNDVDYPASQLFDKTHIKKEQENEIEDSCLSSFGIEDDDNVITILDSDDENDKLINELMDDDDLTKSSECPSSTVETEMAKEIPEFNFVSKPDDDHKESSEKETTGNFCIEQPIKHNKKSKINMEPLVVISRLKDFSNKSTDNAANKSIDNVQFNNVPKGIQPPQDLKDHKTKRKKIEIIDPHHMKPKELKKKKRETESKNAAKSTSKDSSKTSSKKGIKKSSKTVRTGIDSNEGTNKDESLKKRKGHEENDVIEKKRRKIQSTETLHELTESNKNNAEVQNNQNLEEHRNIESESDLKSVEFVPSQYSLPRKEKPKNRTTNVKVKVSKKTRNDMLAEDFIHTTVSKKILESEKHLKSTNTSKMPTSKILSNETNFSTFVIPRRAIPSTSTISMSSQLNTPPRRTENINSPEHVLEEPSEILSYSPDISPAASDIEADVQPIEEPIPQSNSVSLPPQIPENKIIKSNINKRVTFKENIASVREFPVEPGNQLKNIKCGLSTRNHQENYEFLKMKGVEARVEDFLAHIFSWEPIWLEQQQNIRKLPPIVKEQDLHTLPNSFADFSEYYKKMETLLYLETWQQMLKEFECGGRRYSKSAKYDCQMMENSITFVQTPRAKYTTLIVRVLTNKNIQRSEVLPQFGDLIIFQYTTKIDNVLKARKAFAFVADIKQQNWSRWSQTEPSLQKNGQVLDTVLLYYLQTRVIDKNVLHTTTSIMRSLFYLRPYLRLVQALQYLPRSPLAHVILKIDIDNFQLNKMNGQDIWKYPLITMEKLNEKQLEAVIKFTNLVVENIPKIGLLMGPPGTGKSKVIASLVTQIIYGDNRYLSGKKTRILVCAPSNAAVDEIVLRLLEIRSIIKDQRFKMVRIGLVEAMHEEVKKISLLELSNREAHKLYNEQQQKSTEAIEQKKHKLRNDIDALESLVARNPSNKSYRRDLEEAKKIFKLIANKSSEEEANEIQKLQNNAKNTILAHADIIACTLSSCYNGQMESIFGANTSDKISACIVDEATQSCEAETLIPLMLGIKSLILVGDPNQLPATVMSQEAKKRGLDRSLFTRTKDGIEKHCKISGRNDNPLIMLNVQYRMVSSISYWPNKYFYGGRLIDHVGISKNFPLHPYRVLNLDSSQDDRKFSNTQEAEFVGNLVHCIMKFSKPINNKKISIGIITPYQNQKSLITTKIQDQTTTIPDCNKSNFITEVNTIDSFQGQERDVIIMSCVRSNGIGFLSDPQRLCVAMTRAKYSLIICGNMAPFQKDPTWNALLNDARSRGLLLQVNSTASLMEIKKHIVRTI